MTTDNKKFYIVETRRCYDYFNDNKLSYVGISIEAYNFYRQEEPCFYGAELDSYSVGYESYKTLDEVKAIIEQIIQLGCRTNFEYSSLCEDDKRSLDEYITEAKQNLIDEMADIYRGR